MLRIHRVFKTECAHGKTMWGYGITLGHFSLKLGAVPGDPWLMFWFDTRRWTLRYTSKMRWGLYYREGV